MRNLGATAFAIALAVAAPAQAQPDAETQGSSQELAKQLSNPVSSLISVPFQENLDFNGGPNDDGAKSTLNVQPVVPFALSDSWNLILRTIVPIVSQKEVTGPFEGQFGLGDTTQSFFFSPHLAAKGLTVGFGPAFVYPTATDHVLGGGKWGAGPTVVIVKQAGHNTFGMLANHIWSVAGDDDRLSVSTTFLQPFFAHTTASATTFTINTEASYDWKSDHWLVPLIFQITQTTKIGKQPVSVGGGVKYYVERPGGGPDWGIRLIFTLLFPKGPPR